MGRVSRAAAASVVATAILALAGCGTPLATGIPTGGRASGATPTTTGSSSPPTPGATAEPLVAPTVEPPALEPPAGGGLTWKPAGRLVRGQRAVAVSRTRDGRVGLMWMNPDLLSFRYIPGYRFPEGSATLRADNQPSTWTDRLVAAFNGAFELKDGAGGYYYAGTMTRPLRPGLATLAINHVGHLDVTVWGHRTTPAKGTEVVRQNLAPLIREGRSMVSTHDGRATWGNANGGLSTANRTALGQRADGSLVFAYGSEVTASELADALVRTGVRTAIMLDMNKSWPTGFTYTASRGGGLPRGERIQAGIWRDPSTYYHRFEKDFVVALVPRS